MVPPSLDLDKTGCLRTLLRLEDIRDPNSRRENGTTLFMDAAEKNLAFAIVELSADMRTDINAKNNDKEKAALHLAAKAGNAGIVQLLVQDSRINVGVPNNVGDTPLHLAVKHGKAEVVGTLLYADKFHDLRPNEAGQTARQLSCDSAVRDEFKHYEYINALLEFWRLQLPAVRALPPALYPQFVRYAQYAMRKKG